MNKVKSKTNHQEEILQRLDRIEGILIHFVSTQTDLSEDEVLEMVEKGNQEFARGETIEYDDLISSKFPHLA